MCRESQLVNHDVICKPQLSSKERNKCLVFLLVFSTNVSQSNTKICINWKLILPIFQSSLLADKDFFLPET